MRPRMGQSCAPALASARFSELCLILVAESKYESIQKTAGIPSVLFSEITNSFALTYLSDTLHCVSRSGCWDTYNVMQYMTEKEMLEWHHVHFLHLHHWPLCLPAADTAQVQEIVYASNEKSGTQLRSWVQKNVSTIVRNRSQTLILVFPIPLLVLALYLLALNFTIMCIMSFEEAISFAAHIWSKERGKHNQHPIWDFLFSPQE